ncbi:lipase family protein [Thalassomonas viridans]|uniref:Lipase family protein n=1 Tax=Thalassomonas viridans TaxID=137584 RepID=A0AAE9Z236_9GAMM|nr:lipase family protein [Thalassomonas viridans]WDE05163.1 lipase family protein [Thalassomonas viridans]
MSVLTPRIAAELAEFVYQFKNASSTGISNFASTSLIEKNFDFNLSNGPVQGVSGGFFSHLFNRSTGFAVMGQGKSPQYKGQHIIAIRGTEFTSGRDWLTNFHIGLSGSANGSAAHAGFNKAFNSMRPAFQNYLDKNPGGTLHCIGHSLGGALATLTANWAKSEYGREVKLYTFGAPRVGMEGFSIKTNASIEKIYRCTHGADPVPSVPLWPFTHAGTEYQLSSGSGMSIDAHSMTGNSPGYINTAGKCDDFSKLQTISARNISQTVRLQYENRYQAFFSPHWSERISAALITLLKDSGYYAAVAAQATMTVGLTFYDMLARTLTEVAQASAKFAGQATGLLGHMLVFAGKASVKITELTYEFIRWVFSITVNALYRIARQAIDSIN